MEVTLVAFRLGPKMDALKSTPGPATPSLGTTLAFPWSVGVVGADIWAFQRCVEPVVRAVAGLSKSSMRHLAWCIGENEERERERERDCFCASER